MPEATEYAAFVVTTGATTGVVVGTVTWTATSATFTYTAPPMEAERRAMDLLLEHLTSEQRRDFEASNSFVVEGGRTGTKYRLRNHRVSNVDVLDGDRAAYRLCAHIGQEFALGDHLLAQKIVLECDEDAFLSIANRRECGDISNISIGAGQVYFNRSAMECR